MKLEYKYFSNQWALTGYINKNGILREHIQAIVATKCDSWHLFYWAA